MHKMSVFRWCLCLCVLFAKMLLIYMYLYLYLSHVSEMPPQVCPSGHFKIDAMKDCSSWLQCPQIIAEVRTLKLIAKAGAKQMFLSEWRGQKVVLSKSMFPERQDFQDRLVYDVSMLQSLQGPLVVQLVGVCLEEHMIVTEYHPLGSLNNLDTVLAQERHRHHDTWQIRLRLAVDYVSVLSYLHNSPVGCRVMCDTTSLDHTLSQFLLSSNFRLVVNDLDWLPEVDAARGLLAKCFSWEVTGDFLPPEQLWPFADKGLAFNNKLMPGYDEKSDIWKIPEVTRHLMGSVAGGDVALFYLSQVHAKCKRTDPALRPAAQEVLQVYKLVYDNMLLENRTITMSHI